MNAPDREHARAVAARLLAACLPQASPEAALDVVTADFRCWSPLDDWQSGAAGLAALRRVMRVHEAGVHEAGAEPGIGRLQLQAIMTDGEQVVAEASTASQPGLPPVTTTFVLVLNSGLVNQVRCYLDPEVAGG